ncbi:hypothetical protein F511_24302 [Dorcoceras hygrometricum]|uniref:Uncharacterized protein n=1 Tax=Dorcoceras hygrometricum TaxID=472368 RepID=A0A2Z7C9I4_9LAMI|nr:hypothetical protein F511_24302 [Dorcoceras hygrometricum]
MDLLEWKKGPLSLYPWKEGILWDSKGGVVGTLMPLDIIFHEPKHPKECRRFNRGSEDSPALYHSPAVETAKKLELNLLNLRFRNFRSSV